MHKKKINQTKHTVFGLVILGLAVGTVAWLGIAGDVMRHPSLQQDEQGLNTSYVETIEENFENMTAGASFETGRSHWVVTNPSYGSSTAEIVAGSKMGRVYCSSSGSTYDMTYTFSSAGSYTPGVKIEFDMATAATYLTRRFQLGPSNMSDIWFISFDSTGYIHARNFGSEVSLMPYSANTRYHVKLEFAGNMHQVDVTINGTKYDNSGAHFSSYYGATTKVQSIRLQTGQTSVGWIAIDNIDASWINRTLPDEPAITHPSDITYTGGQTGNSISWIITDVNASTRTYTIYRNGSVITSGSWISGVAIAQNVDGLAVGLYNYTIVANDGYGHLAQDTVIVNVIANQAPAITNPANITYTGGQTGNWIYWTITDANTGTRSYTVYANSTPVASGSWMSGSQLSLNVDGLAVGLYNYTIFATDGYGASVQDEVVVTVLNGMPTISNPANITYTAGQTGNVISWTIIDWSTITRSYTVYVNGSTPTSGSWTSGVAVTRNVDGLVVGSYNYTIVATDGYGASTQDEVVVTVLNGMPTISNPANITYTAGQTGNIISWTIIDASTSVTAYTVYVNGSTPTSGSWTSGVAVTRNVDGLVVGSYNYTIVATDGYGTSVQDTVIVNVLANIAPTITQPGNITYTMGYTGNYIYWTITDATTASRSFTIYVNGSSPLNGTWTSGSQFSWNVNGLAVGSYNYTIYATDGLGLSVQDEVIVKVVNGIPTISHPSDITYTMGNTGYYIYWTVTDLSTTTRSYTVYVNGSTPANGSWTSGSQFSWNVDGLVVGSYNYTIFATDGYGASVQDTVIVKVVNGNPTISHPADRTYEYDYKGIAVSWTITDASTTTRAYTIFADDSVIAIGTWTSGVAVSIDLDSIAPGRYNITIVAIDGYGARVQDYMWLTRSAGQTTSNALEEAAPYITLTILGAIGASLVLMLIVGPVVSSKRGMGKPARDPNARGVIPDNIS